MTDNLNGRLRFDPVLNWGHVAVCAAVISSGIGVYIAGEIRATTLETRVHFLEASADRYANVTDKLNDQLADIKAAIAAITARLSAAPPFSK